MTERLSTTTAKRLPRAVERPQYDRAAQGIGIVHLGLGAFTRAHQAVYTDAAMSAGDRDWMIAGVSLRSAGVRDALAPQDGLYTVTERSASGERTRLIGAVRDVVVAAEASSRPATLIAAPGTRLVTLTVTEKAYAQGGAIYPVLADGLGRRRAAGLTGLTLVSCDNLADNGGVLARGLAAWLDRTDPDLRRWFERECACPATMVDRIVPATTAEDVARVQAAIALTDQGTVVTEPFSQWVIEDRFAGPRPRWEMLGGRFVGDVAAYETAKLRMLNGAHSALAYLGLGAGHDFVHQAIADPAIAVTVERLMRDEAAASLDPVPGQDLVAYADTLLDRFRNPALPHRLAQIAVDGSQKIPQRWLEPLAINAARGRRCPATLAALAAWIVYVRGNGVTVVDPLSAQLAARWREGGRDGILAGLFGDDRLLGGRWRPDVQDEAVLMDAIDALADRHI